MAPCQGACPGAIPSNRTSLRSPSFVSASQFHTPSASLRSRVSKTQRAWGNTKAACQFHGVVADKQCTCPASKPMRERYPPTPPISLRGTRLKHREKPHKLLQVSVILTPATIAYAEPSREMIQLPDCKSGVRKQNWKRRTGALPASPTSLHEGFGPTGHFGSVAQSEEQPVVCGKAEGASPFGSANFIGM